MTSELQWLLYTVLMTALFWLPYILDRLKVRGVIPAMTGNEAEEGVDHSPWAKRARAAHRNAVENLVIFAAAVLACQALGISTPATAWAALIYFFARLVHYVVYTLGVPYLRTLSFAAGFACQLVLIFSALGWMR
ncbi:MAG: MAPEG family protein [Proteobacteria bacterium]|nr:MAPEG family protein [Pseudomonadota bacterium]